MDALGKKKLKDEVAEKFKKSAAVVFAEYRGLTVEKLTELRVELRKADAEFNVVKNRIAVKAIELDVPEMSELTSELKGPLGVLCAYGDSAQAMKTLLEFEKNNEKFVVKTGYLEQSKMSVDELKAIADLPSKEVLMGKIVGSIIAPHRGLVTTLSGVSRNLVQVLGAIKDKKQG
tara:strand:- start:316 stop:840 length:525 start_codon:yes stop_codon:yes gene_type:complete